MGVNSEKLSVDKDLAGYETLKEGIYTGKVKYYRHEWFLKELKRLELVKGKKVDHPATAGGSKDVCDAVAGAVYNAVANKNNFSFGFPGKDKTPEEKIKEVETMPVDGLMPYGYMRGRRE
jgi:hypothetical protein